MCGADACQRGVIDQEVIVAAEWGVSHHRHIVLFAPWQKVTLNAAVVEIIWDLIGRAAMTVRNTEEVFHLAYVEVGYAPSSNLFCRM